jgi:hypothetical protein
MVASIEYSLSCNYIIPQFCGACLGSVRFWPQVPVRGGAAIWPLSVEHRTIGGTWPIPPLLILTGHSPVEVAPLPESIYGV